MLDLKTGLFESPGCLGQLDSSLPLDSRFKNADLLDQNKDYERRFHQLRFKAVETMPKAPSRDVAMGHNLWLHFGVDEHPFATYFDFHQGYRVWTHSHVFFSLGQH